MEREHFVAVTNNLGEIDEILRKLGYFLVDISSPQVSNCNHFFQPIIYANRFSNRRIELRKIYHGGEPNSVELLYKGDEKGYDGLKRVKLLKDVEERWVK